MYANIIPKLACKYIHPVIQSIQSLNYGIVIGARLAAFEKQLKIQKCINRIVVHKHKLPGLVNLNVSNYDIP